MSSIIERIEEAESTVVTIRRDASVNAKALVSDAEIASSREIDDANRSIRSIKRQYLEEAEDRAGEIAERLIAENRSKADELYESAKPRVPLAAEHIIERLLEL